MRLKVDKSIFLDSLETEVKDAVQYTFQVQSQQYYGQPVNINLNEVISRAVAAGVTRAMEKLIDEQYTDADFERDLTLTE